MPRRFRMQLKALSRPTPRTTLGCLLLGISLPLVTFTAPGCSSSASTPLPENVAAPLRVTLPIAPLQANALGFSVNWAVDLAIPANQQLESATLVDDVLLTVEGPRNLVTAIDARNGSRRWTRAIGSDREQLFAPIGDERGLLFSSENRLFTVNPTSGRVLNISNLPHRVSATPQLIDDFAIYGGTDGTVFAQDVDAGSPRWRYRMAGGITHRPAAATSPRGVFVGDTAGTYAMLHGQSGRLLWKAPTFGPITAPPLVLDDLVLVASLDRTLYALDAAEGRERWTHQTTVALSEPVTQVGPWLFLPVPGRAVRALDPADGSVQWELPADHRVLQSLPGDRLLVIAPGRLRIIDAQQGHELAQAAIEPLSAVVAGPEGSLILVSPHGRLVRLIPLS